jgi:cytochrome P450
LLIIWPTGSIILANAWYVGRLCRFRSKRSSLHIFRAILHDSEIFPDPEEFRPERFLDKDGSFRDDLRIALAFGAGKRICPGRHFVDATAFIVASSVLSVFNVTKAKDENGYEIPVKVALALSGVLV